MLCPGFILPVLGSSKTMSEKVITVRRGAYSGVIIIPDDKFKEIVRGPLSLVKHTGSTAKTQYDWKQLEEEFYHQLTLCFTYGHLAKSQVAKKSELKELQKEVEALNFKIFKLNLDIELEELDRELDYAELKINRLIKDRVKVAASKYPPSIIVSTKHMIKWWNKITGNRIKITYYTPGLKYQQEEYKGTKPDKIKPKDNPAGAFIQGVLTTYFRCPITQMQLKRLLALAYESES